MSRLDRLVTILETGSTPFVRNTAADQLADLAKQHPHDTLNLLARVYPFLFHKKWETRTSAARAFGGIVSHIPQWDPNSEFQQRLQNVTPNENDPDAILYQQIKKEEGMEDLQEEDDNDEVKDDPEAKSKLSQMIDTDKYEAMLVSFKDWDFKGVIDSGCVLLSVNEDSFNVFKNVASESMANNKKFKTSSFTKKIGFDDLISVQEIKREIKSEMGATSSTSGSETATATNSPNMNVNAVLNTNTVTIKREDSNSPMSSDSKSPKLSARMRALAKRKAKFGGSKPMTVDITQSSVSSQLESSNALNGSNNNSGRSTPSNGNMDITSQQQGSKLVIENKPLQESISSFAKFADHVWILQGIYELLIKSLFSPNWEIRHGSTLGLREILKFKSQALSAGRVSGKSNTENDLRNKKTLQDLSVRILAVLSMDRFGDYVSDTVVAPVRENVSQVLAAILRWVDNETTELIFNALCELVKQDDLQKQCWEAKHGGLLGLRYFVSIKPEYLLDNQQLLLKTSEIVIECLRGNENDLDRDDDVQTVAAAILLPITKQFVSLQRDLVKELLSVLWSCLIDLKDDLAAATGSVMDLLGSLCQEKVVCDVLREMSISSAEWNFTALVPRLYPFLRHSLSGVRKSVLKTLLSFIEIEDDSMHDWINGHIIRLIFQNLLVERNDEILDLSFHLYKELINYLSAKNNNSNSNNTPGAFDSILSSHIGPLIDLMITPVGLPRFNFSMNPANILRPSGHCMALNDIQLTGINFKNFSNDPHSRPHNGTHNSTNGRKRKQDSPDTSNNIDGHVANANTNGKSNMGIPESEYDLHVNIDAPMINGDVTLVSIDTIYKTRLMSAKAMGITLSKFSVESNIINVLTNLLDNLRGKYLTSRLVSSWIINEFFSSVSNYGKIEGIDYGKLSQCVTPILLQLLNIPATSLPFFKEIVPLLRTTRSHSSYLLSLFKEQAHLSSTKLKVLAVLVTGENEAGPGAFSLNDARDLIDNWYGNSYKSLNAATRISIGKALENAKDRVRLSVEEVEDEMHSRLNSVNSSIAGAVIHAIVFEGDGKLPSKLNPIIRSLMDGVKLCDSELIQHYISESVASLIKQLIREGRNNIADKMVKNLCGFLCVDPLEVPEYAPYKSFDGIVSLVRDGRDNDVVKEAAASSAIDSSTKDGEASPKIIDFEVKGAIVKRRGGKFSLKSLVELFKGELFDKLPKLKLIMVEPFAEMDESKVDHLTDKEGQSIIDAYELIRTLFPWITVELQDEVLTHIEVFIKGLNSKQSVFRYSSSKCIASIVSTRPTIGFQILVEKIIPMLNNPLETRDRQGAVECIYHVVQMMESTILPYVVFLIVPILGRMSDSNQDVRLISTLTFAQIIKLVPLESGIPDPVDMPEILLAGRQKEREFLSQMMDPTKIEPFELPVSIKATLRKYQQEGINWLYFLNKYHLHGILCDDMGLGKTLQTICMVASDHYLRSERFKKNGSVEDRRLPSLIVCPPSLTGHWEQEFNQYATFMKVLVYAGPPSVRSQLRNTIQTGVREQIDVIVTSYDVVRNDVDFITQFDFNYCVLDEGHIIKNPKSALSKCVKLIKANHRLLLSGTPIQNNVVELWSLFDFLMPGFLGTYKQFETKFAKPIALSRKSKGKKEQERGALVLESLHKQVLPFMLRRLKEDVLSDLPPKIIQDYYCTLSNLQKQLYKDFISKQKKNVIKDIESAGPVDDDDNTGAGADQGKNAKQHVFQVLQYMRKLCNHPSLVLTREHPQFQEVSNYLKKYNMKLDDIEHAPKLLALKNLLKECGIGNIGTESSIISQHRALVFCQMKDMLDIVENDLLKKHMPNVTYLRMDGSTDPRYRQNIVKKFNEDPSIDILLLTTKVGGLGLNLTGADTVIFVEHDWNPMNDLQAMDRAHRLGQKRVVNVYRLITRDTLEEKIMGLQKFKMNIASSIVNQQNSGLASMDTHQLLDLFNSDSVGKEDEEGVKEEKMDSGAGTGANVADVASEDGLGGKAGSAVKELGELWDTKQYEEEYNLSQFISTLQ